MSLNPDAPAATIRSFVTGRVRATFDDDDDIFALGFVNSLFALELVVFIEKAFAIRLPNEVLTLDNFRSVNAMARMIDGQTRRAPDPDLARTLPR
jgi:acyl carrier protein